MKIWVTLAAVTAVLIGCTSDEDRILFDGQYYSAKLRKVDRQLDVFTVTVKPVSKSLAGALQAGTYEATAYCVNSFGNSDILWTAGPDAPEDTLLIEGDVLTLQGRCPDAR